MDVQVSPNWRGVSKSPLSALSPKHTFCQNNTTSVSVLVSRLSSFSNRGLGVIDVAAPGSSILSTIVRNNGYGLKSGTSMASPHVAGVLALMKSAHPSWTPAEMIAKIRQQADDKACSTTTAGAPCVGPVADNSYFGEGMVDALDAVS